MVMNTIICHLKDLSLMYYSGTSHLMLEFFTLIFFTFLI